MAKVLVIGSGGREHALAWKFQQSPLVDIVYVAPGNDGMKDVATLVSIDVNDFENLATFVIDNSIDLTFVGPEIPLVNGIVDFFEAKGLNIFGPRKNAAILEGSKSFAKELMTKYNIPTAQFRTFSCFDDAINFVSTCSYPLVIKADGLAAGKGVSIVASYEEAYKELENMMVNELFANSSSSVVIEEYLTGEEFSLMAFVDNEKVYAMQIAQDHKRAFDGDNGPNTGGMGAYTPVSHLSAEVVTEALNLVMIPVAKAMISENRPYTGILYGGFMATSTGVKTIEFNCRFGDPETEVILQALVGDLYEITNSVLNHKRPTYSFSSKTYLGVVMASKGYPNEYSKGDEISNICNNAPTIFHMGTKECENKCIINGGRVLFVSGEGPNIKEAYESAYSTVRSIRSNSLFYRNDIGHLAIAEVEND